MGRPHRLAWIMSNQCMPAHTKCEAGAGGSACPPRSDDHSLSRPRPRARRRRSGNPRRPVRSMWLPPEGGRHMLREVTDNRPIFVEPELVGDGQQQGVGFRERPVLTQLRDEGVGVGRVGSSEGGYRRVEVADLISGCAQAVQARVAPGEQGEDRARDRHSGRPRVSHLGPRPPVGAQLVGLNISEWLVCVLEDEGRAHEVDAVARGLNRRGVGSCPVPDPASQPLRVREDGQRRSRGELRRVLLVQGRGLGHGNGGDGVEEAFVVSASEIRSARILGAVAKGLPAPPGDFGCAAGHAQRGAAVRDQVEGGGLLGEVQGVLVSHVDDAGADFDGLGARGDGRQEGHGCSRLGRVVVDAEERAVDADLVGSNRKVDCLVQGLGSGYAMAGAVRVVAEAEESKVLHGVSLRPSS